MIGIASIGQDNGVWESLAIRVLWEHETPGSNPGSPIMGQIIQQQLQHLGRYRIEDQNKDTEHLMDKIVGEEE